MVHKTFEPKLWTPRSVEDTQQVYAEWAATYESDVTAMNYATPGRVASALAGLLADRDVPVLDFGCGTGLSGMALFDQGFSAIDGTDISEPMLAQARDKGVYRHIALGAPGEVPAQPGSYGAIVATGVVSLGAAPPEMLVLLLNALAPDALLAFSYNDPTLADRTYLDALEAAISNGVAVQEFREHGPHLSEKVTGADVIVLRRL